MKLRLSNRKLYFYSILRKGAVTGTRYRDRDRVPSNSMNFSCRNKRAFLSCNFSQLSVMIRPSKNSWAQICTQRMFWPKVKSFQGQSGLVKMPNGGPRHFDRRWATCLGSRELLPWWQSWAGQAAGKKGGPPSVKVAHKYGDWRYYDGAHDHHKI